MKTLNKRIILRLLALLMIATVAAIPGLLLYIFIDNNIYSIFMVYAVLIGVLIGLLLIVLVLIGFGCLISYLFSYDNNTESSDR